MNEVPPNSFRVFMVDQTCYDFYMKEGTTWDGFVYQLKANGFMATNDALITLDSIVKILRIYPGPTQPTGTVIDFPTKGSA